MERKRDEQNTKSQQDSSGREVGGTREEVKNGGPKKKRGIK